MKKRKWAIWLFILLIKSIIDIIVMQLYVSVPSLGITYSNINKYINYSIGIGILVGLICLVATKFSISRAIKDAHFEIKYQFWTAGIIGLLIGLMCFYKGLLYDIYILGPQNMIANAENETLGHPIPAFMIFWGALGIFMIAAGFEFGVSGQLNYRNKRIAAQEEK